jgi:hypothetical protein
MKHMLTQLLFAAALALGTASAAHAFTFEGTAPGDGGGGVQRNYADPDDQLQPKAGATQHFDGGQGDAQKEGFSVQFGGGQNQSFDQKYNSNDFFDPLKR